MVRKAISIPILASAIVLSACNTSPATGRGRPTPARVSAAPRVDPIPAEALPGVSSDPVALDASTLALDAFHPAALESLLGDAGFVGGTERTFSRTAGGRRRALVRVLVFESPVGADKYLGWLEHHVEEVIGRAHPVSGLLVPAGTLVFDHEPNPCCHSETRLVLVAWRAGARVVTLELGGQVVETSSVPEVVSELRASI